MFTSTKRGLKVLDRGWVGLVNQFDEGDGLIVCSRLVHYLHRV